jgi:hypothetical protein
MKAVLLARQNGRDIDLNQIVFFDLCSSTKNLGLPVCAPLGKADIMRRSKRSQRCVVFATLTRKCSRRP